jgi:hypothetical protein
VRREPLVGAMLRAVLLAVMCAFACGAGARAQSTDPLSVPAPGPYIAPRQSSFATPKGFTSSDRIVATYYFYWYDSQTKAHIVDADGSDALTDHPSSLKDFTWRSKIWHRYQMTDMIEAGIDVVLPVFWDDNTNFEWATQGLAQLSEALGELKTENRSIPLVGMFYDTSSLAAEGELKKSGERPDLTTSFGKALFYKAIRDFFSMVPPDLWATIDGRPIVWLYSSTFASKYDRSTLDFARTQFAHDFGGKDLYIVREVSWDVPSESMYAWGGALAPKLYDVASIGPGYDHSAVEGREPLVKDREGGAFYRSSWDRVMRAEPNIVAIETWNEFHEGTDIAESKEYGRKYIETTAGLAKTFKTGGRLPPIMGQYSFADSVSIECDDPIKCKGIKLVQPPDGRVRTTRLDGRACLEPVDNPFGDTKYIYFDVDDSFGGGDPLDAEVTVVANDLGRGQARIDYDSTDKTAAMGGAYKPTGVMSAGGTGGWKVFRVRLDGARLLGRENGGADFRIAVLKGPYYLRSVEIRRAKKTQ